MAAIDGAARDDFSGESLWQGVTPYAGTGRTMRAMHLEDQIHIPTTAVAGGLVTLVLGGIGWLVRLSANQIIKGFDKALQQHAEAIKGLSDEVAGHRREVSDLRVEIAEVVGRLKVIERDRQGGAP